MNDLKIPLGTEVPLVLTEVMPKIEAEPFIKGWKLALETGPMFSSSLIKHLHLNRELEFRI